jgi:serine O-acetyltransferase
MDALHPSLLSAAPALRAHKSPPPSPPPSCNLINAPLLQDPASTSYSQALLYYKGYHAIQTHRIAHALWNRGQKVMAVALQSRMSEVLAVDIHPAARIGKGILLDHGTGVVIGETAVIGNNVSLLQVGCEGVAYGVGGGAGGGQVGSGGP